jgi:hypothetical protein
VRAVAPFRQHRDPRGNPRARSLVRMLLHLPQSSPPEFRKLFHPTSKYRHPSGIPLHRQAPFFLVSFRVPRILRVRPARRSLPAWPWRGSAVGFALLWVPSPLHQPLHRCPRFRNLR